ncbi:epsin-1 [Teleopsis dalmanni]|uniref:epsin-1 n=1 Tax=Teleopsis dalmanni TaxID=139649 RepID=UPI0018CC9ACB|nr:epsin-1 [Teleopsis dalmanni]
MGINKVCREFLKKVGVIAQAPKSRHFPVNGLSSNSQLHQQQQQQQQQQQTDTRNIYNNPYTPSQQQQQLRSQQHIFKSIANSTGSGNQYDYSSTNSNEQLGASEADNAFLTHNNAFNYSNRFQMRIVAENN